MRWLMLGPDACDATREAGTGLAALLAPLGCSLGQHSTRRGRGDTGRDGQKRTWARASTGEDSCAAWGRPPDARTRLRQVVCSDLCITRGRRNRRLQACTWPHA